MPHITAYCVQHIPGSNNNIIADAIISLSGCLLQETHSRGCNNTRHHPCMANPSLHNQLLQLCYHSVPESTCQTYQSGLIAYTSFFCFNINPLPATSLTLQYFCANKSQSISYQTLKVYLAAICLMHGLPDPRMDLTLLLVCRGIRQQKKVTERRLPITIDILKSLKSYLRLSNYTLCEQRMLWSSFTLSFYGFLRASECLSLISSNIKRTGNHLVIELH